MGAMQVRKHELGGFSMGDDFEQRVMPFLQTDPFANMKYGTYEHVCQLSSLDCVALVTSISYKVLLTTTWQSSISAFGTSMRSTTIGGVSTLFCSKAVT